MGCFSPACMLAAKSSVETHKSVLRPVPKKTFRGNTPRTAKVGSAQPEFFFSTCQKKRLEMVGIRNEASACQLPCATLAVQPYSPALWSGPSRSPTLGRAVASSSHCQPLGPKDLQARSRPTADPPKVNSSQKRAHPDPIKHNQKRSPNIRVDRRATK